MNYSEVELLSRAHQLFAGDSRRPGLDAGTTPYGDLLSRAADLNVGAGQRRYQLAVDHSRATRLASRPRSRDANQMCSRESVTRATHQLGRAGWGREHPRHRLPDITA